MTPTQGNTSSRTLANDWPTLLKDNQRTGGQQRVGVGAPNKVRWQMRLGTSIRSAPVFSNGLLYVTGIEGALFAIDTAIGRLKWKFEIEDVSFL